MIPSPRNKRVEFGIRSDSIAYGKRRKRGKRRRFEASERDKVEIVELRDEGEIDGDRGWRGVW